MIPDYGTPDDIANRLREHLRALLEDVGFRLDRWFGDWDRIIPFTPSDAADVVVATSIR